jgi:lysophospholipase L1-like esterase
MPQTTVPAQFGSVSLFMPFRNALIPLLIVLALLGGRFGWWAWWSEGRGGAPAVYVALGASDAVGVGADVPEREGWVPLVHASLPRGAQLLNLGISGATLGDVLRDEIPPALDARPRWVTLWPGINDLRAGVALPVFAGQLDRALGQLTAPHVDSPAAPPVVLVLNIPDLRRLPAFAGIDPALLDATVRQWNSAIAAAAQRHRAGVVDLYTQGPDLRTHPEYISSDGFHPSSAGYRRIAEIAVAALERHVSSLTIQNPKSKF